MRFKKSYFVLAVACFPVLFFLQNPLISQPVQQGSLTVLKPFLIAGTAIVQGADFTRRSLIHFWNAFGDQSRYPARIAALESQLARYDETVRENERLKKLLNFKQSLPYKSIAAHVIGWHLSPWRKIIILDKGSRHGLHKDMTVVIEEGLIGRVLEAGPETSRAILLTDPDSRVSSVTEQSRSQGTVHGDGSVQLTLNYLDLDSGVAVGEKLLTSGIGGLFPKGLEIGKIESLQRSQDGLHLTARIEPWAQFSKLEEVLCLEFSRAA